MSFKSTQAEFFDLLFAPAHGSITIYGDDSEGNELDDYVAPSIEDIWGYSFVESRKDSKLFTSVETTLGEIVAVCGGAEMRTKLHDIEPSLTLARGDEEFYFWVLEVPIDDTYLDACRAVLRLMDHNLECPFPGVNGDGWQLVDSSDEEMPVYPADYFYNREISNVDEQVDMGAGSDAVVGSADDVAFEVWPNSEAKVYTLENFKGEYFDREIEFASNTSANVGRGTWTNQQMALGVLVNVLAPHKVGDKDGDCITQGPVIDGIRQAKAVRQLDFIMLDLDTGVTMNEMRDKLMSEGLFAIMWTTHSHGATFSDVNKDAVIRHYKLDGADPTEDQVISFLRDVKLYREDVLATAELDPETVHTAKGIQLRVHHKAMSKFRILCPLKEPFVIGERGSSQKDAITEWKERYLGFSAHLGAFADTTCVDPSRLMYMPRHKEGAEHETVVIAGEFLDINTVDRVDARSKKKARPASTGNPFIDNAGGGDTAQTKTTFRTAGLSQFLAKFSHMFLAADFMEHYDPDGFVEERTNGEGHTHACPFQDQHTAPESGEDMGFFVVNGPDNDHSDGFTMYCSHTCPDDRAVLLDEFCVQHGLKIADLYEFVDDNEVIEDGASGDSNGHRTDDVDRSSSGGLDEKKRNPRLPPRSLNLDGFKIATFEDDNGDKEQWVYAIEPSTVTPSGESVGGGLQRLFPPVQLVATLRNRADDTVGHLWRFTDAKGVEREVELDSGAVFANASKEFLYQLRNKGLRMTEKGSKILTKWAMSVQPRYEIHQMPHPGWWDHVFITPLGEAINSGRVECLLNAKHKIDVQSRGGDLEGWKDAIKLACEHDQCDHFQVGIISGFLGPIINLCGFDSTVIFYNGTTSKGKSTCQMLGTSAWSTPETNKGLFTTINGTENASEWVISLGNGSFVGLDEMGVKDAKMDVQKLIFMIAGGKGKSRMTATGAARDSYTWKTLVTMSGEVDLFHEIEKSGNDPKGGISVRCLPISVDDVPNLDAKRVAKFYDGILQNYGHAGPAFVEGLIEAGYHENPEAIKADIDELCGDIIGDEVSSAQRRAARVIGLIYWCGNFAQDIGLLPDTLDIKGLCERIWEARQNDVISMPINERAAQNVIREIARRRKIDIYEAGGLDNDHPEHRSKTPVGFYAEGECIYIPVDKLQELSHGLGTIKMITKELAAQDYLIKRSAGGRTHNTWETIVGEGSRTRHIRIRWDSVFGGTEDATDTT